MVSLRTADEADIGDIERVIDAANTEILPLHFSDPTLVDASRAFMSLDRLLVSDRTYFVAEDGDEIVGCGGWSRRTTLYGGDGASGRNPSLLDPKTQAAKIRAMYTHPRHLRRGIGRLILRAAEDAARREGFTRAEMGATLAGVPLYRALGYVEIAPIEHAVDGTRVPLVRMGRDLSRSRESGAALPGGTCADPGP